MSDEGRSHELMDRLEAECGSLQAIDALRLAVSALGYVAEARTLTAAATTAKGALLGIHKALAAENFNAVMTREASDE
jgi:hypothetical protein